MHPSLICQRRELKYVGVERRAEIGDWRLESKKFRFCWVILGEAVPISMELETG